MDAQLAQAILQNLINTFVDPEIKRRYEAGLIPTLPMPLNAVQVILPGDGRTPPIVRLNEETRIRASAVLKPGVSHEEGRELGLDDIERIDRMFSANPEDANAGHIAIKWVGEQVVFDFDFRYNRESASSLVTVASEFVQAARYAESELHSWSVFVEVLFSALELAVKAFLWTTPYGTAFKAKMSHPTIQQSFAQFPTALNNLQGQADALGQLWRERNSARYLHTPVQPRWDEGHEWLRYTEQMLALAKSQVELVPTTRKKESEGEALHEEDAEHRALLHKQELVERQRIPTRRDV